MACPGRQIAVLSSVPCAGLAHLEECSGQGVCAGSLLRWMGRHRRDAVSQPRTGWSTSFPRSRRMLCSLTGISIRDGSSGVLFPCLPFDESEGQRNMAIWGLSSLLLRCQKRPQVICHDSGNIYKIKKKIPQTWPIILFKK